MADHTTASATTRMKRLPINVEIFTVVRFSWVGSELTTTLSDSLQPIYCRWTPNYIFNFLICCKYAHVCLHYSHSVTRLFCSLPRPSKLNDERYGGGNTEEQKPARAKPIRPRSSYPWPTNHLLSARKLPPEANIQPCLTHTHPRRSGLQAHRTRGPIAWPPDDG